MSTAQLSLAISNVVARASRGEAIDARSEGDALAALYPDLGMSGELIGRAIGRAAAMIGVTVSGADEPEPLPEAPPAAFEALPDAAPAAFEFIPEAAPEPPTGVDLDARISEALEEDLAAMVLEKTAPIEPTPLDAGERGDAEGDEEPPRRRCHFHLPERGPAAVVRRVFLGL